ncbi:unnamed protein product [Arabis nemorensis]|uniref:SKP1-like protein n=1 Tax=Arabis nemorensis TaxID=586526 RepID=A0A565BGR9_9BRAS|nr:unnamed protein product [Arabis nemorensis]
MSNSKKIVLKSSDGQMFEIEEEVALQSQTIAHMVEDGCVDAIPISNVSGEILAKVNEYCKKHVDGGGSEEELKIWDQEFMRNINQSTLFYLILAANYLNIKSLLDLTCQTVADMITSKTPDEIRTILDIKSDFTPEEEEKIRQENQWAFE